MKEKENIRENKWDKLLKIHTMGRDDSNADQYHYPYEPTPYSVFHIRPGVHLLVWNMMKESIIRQ